jgi:hypothetical protein
VKDIHVGVTVLYHSIATYANCFSRHANILKLMSASQHNITLRSRSTSVGGINDLSKVSEGGDVLIQAKTAAVQHSHVT